MSAFGFFENGQLGIVTLKSEYFESNMQKPSWCFVVKTRYLKPSRRAVSAQTSGWKRTGLNDSAIDQYSRLNASPSVCQSTRRRDHPASLSTSGHDSMMPSCVYIPKWTMSPSLRSRKRSSASRTAGDFGST